MLHPKSCSGFFFACKYLKNIDYSKKEEGDKAL